MTRSSADDACPGALRLHEAADGPLARVRLPGGMLTSEQLAALAQAAGDHGAPVLELTSRGNLQIRGIRDADAVSGLLTAVGLLPSASHERARNIVASPLSGRVGDFPDIRPMVHALDRGLVASPALAELPGRFLFGLDDGRGDMDAMGADIGLRHEAAGWRLLIDGHRTSECHDDAVECLLAVADVFVRTRENAWRVAELPSGAETLAKTIGATLIEGPPDALPAPRAPVGWIEQRQSGDLVTLGAAVPLGQLPASLAALLAAAEKPVVITPWRSLLLCDLLPEEADSVLRVLAPMGLVFDDRSPWLNISSCTGSPGCARSRTDVHADVRLDVAEELASGIHSPVHRHWVGCPRACGSPSTGQVLVATELGYRPLERN
ncbi:precorrin-3B synthase [Mycobacterium sp. CBMA271]|uniref:precorrin-3B synthase n=1 Tax=unclassified Mycobacteroides TaxID=2618759 RepID=UPI00132A2658|nr:MULTISPECIES: precorrin-3B synthase [unclassified Mycobacteroides]MUM18794.1 precorrin-3B synthase [Mycobacteroides sp. CBMA 326]MUM22757.1 precorrin-3B synthase [Mycobacteroides sp. CBMA 271]